MDVFLLAFLFGCTSLSKSFIINMAEGVGFEPTDPCGSPVFKTGAIDHSAIPPISAPRLLSAAFLRLYFRPFSARCRQLLPKFQKYTNDGAWLAERCEYFRTRATATTIIISIGSRSTESESVFISQAKAFAGLRTAELL